MAFATITISDELKEESMEKKTSKVQAAFLAAALLLPSSAAFAKVGHHSKAKGALVGGVAGAAVGGKKGAVVGAGIGTAVQHHKNKKAGIT